MKRWIFILPLICLFPSKALPNSPIDPSTIEVQDEKSGEWKRPNRPNVIYKNGRKWVRKKRKNLQEKQQIQRPKFSSFQPTPTPIPTPREVEKRITLNLKNLPLDSVLRAVTAQTKLNFITSGNIGHIKLTAFMKEVTVEEALEGLLAANGLVYEQVGESNVYVVKERKDSSPRVTTKVFQLKYIQLARSGKDEKGGKSSGFTFKSSSSSSSGDSKKGDGAGNTSGVVSIVNSMLSANGSLQVDSFTNSLVVTDVPERFPRISKAIRKLDVLPPQILIDVKIVESDNSDNSKRGIDWGGPDGALASVTGPSRVIQGPLGGGVFPGAAELAGASVSSIGEFGNDPLSGISYGVLSMQEFKGVLRAIEVEGKGRFLAKPSIVTLNNRPAQIAILADTAVGVESASLIAQNGLLVATAERQPTGISLDVTPQVNADELVTLLINASISRPKSSEFFPDQFVDAHSRAVNTSVTVQNNDTVLIGGLVSENESETTRKVPVLGHIPIIGLLFTSKEKAKNLSEVTIFITPRVITLGNMGKQKGGHFAGTTRQR